MVCSLVSIYFDNPQLDIKYKQTYTILDYRSKDMLNFDFL